MTDLSPAAQSVMIAGTMGNQNVVNDPVYRQCIAAALRAAADHLRNAYANEECIDSADDFLDGIAAELDGNNV
jgi:hypothetical protein